MSFSKYPELLVTNREDGATLTAAAAASAIPAAAKFEFPAGFFFNIGKQIRVRAYGRQSNVVTTPGTVTWELRFTGPTGTVVSVFASGAMTMNIVAKTNVPYELDFTLKLGVKGTAAQFFPGPARWSSESVIASPTGASGTHILPFGGAPALGNAFDATVPQIADLFYTPSLATASQTLHNYELWADN